MCIQEKLKFPVKASVPKYMQNFFAKIVQSVYFFLGFPKSYKMLKSSDWK